VTCERMVMPGRRRFVSLPSSIRHGRDGAFTDCLGSEAQRLSNVRCLEVRGKTKDRWRGLSLCHQADDRRDWNPEVPDTRSSAHVVGIRRDSREKP